MKNEFKDFYLDGLPRQKPNPAVADFICWAIRPLERLVWFFASFVSQIIDVSVNAHRSTLRSNCQHQHTRPWPRPWPGGYDLELCVDCGCSRLHWEQGETEWAYVSNLEHEEREQAAEW